MAHDGSSLVIGPHISSEVNRLSSYLSKALDQNTRELSSFFALSNGCMYVYVFGWVYICIYMCMHSHTQQVYILPILQPTFLDVELLH